jgi:hypothetical protein
MILIDKGAMVEVCDAERGLLLACELLLVSVGSEVL